MSENFDQDVKSLFLTISRAFLEISKYTIPGNDKLCSLTSDCAGNIGVKLRNWYVDGFVPSAATLDQELQNALNELPSN